MTAKAFAKVGDLAEQIRGVSYAKSDSSSEPGPGLVPVLRAGNITEHGLTLDDLVYVPEGCVSERQRVRRHDIVIAASSGSLSVVGKAAAADRDLDAGFGAFCKVLRPSRAVDPRYFSHFFRTPDYRRRMTAAAAGANINNLRGRDLDNLEIPVPPIEEQRRIAALLDQADTLRAKRRESLALLDTVTEATFLDMFGDPALNPIDWPNEPIESLADGRDGIKCGPFGTQLGQDEYQESGVPLWGIRHVNRRFSIATQEFLTAGKAEKLAAFSLLGGDIVMTRKGTVGNCAVYPRAFEPGVMHSDLLRIRLSAAADPEFLSAQMRFSRDVQAQIGFMSGGAIMAGINVTKLKAMRVLVPPIGLQREFAARVHAVERVHDQHVAARSRLDQLFASLQQRAFRGDL